MKLRQHIHLLPTALSVLLLLLCVPVSAQTVGWRLPLTNYSSIVRFGPDLFQVEQGGNVGLIHSDGTEVVPVKASKIGGFYDGLALVTVDEGANRSRILGVLDTDGRYTPFSQPFYTLSGQEFFSEGLLSVMDGNEKKGYIDATGARRCGFDHDYSRIKPFTGGFAAVSVKGTNKYYLINRQGVPLSITLPDELMGHTILYTYNPVRGKVLYYDDYAKCCKYDIESHRSERWKELDDPKKLPPSDYLFRPQEVLKMLNEKVLDKAPFTTLPDGRKGLEPYMQNGKYGFVANGETVLPCQLDSATAFEDGLSVVSLNGRLGILSYYEGQQGFELTTPQAQLDFDGGSSVVCQFLLQVPQAWKGKPVSVTLLDKDSHGEVSHTGDNGQFAFQLTPEHSVQKSYEVSVASEGLQLWTGELNYTLKKKAVGLSIGSLVLDADITNLDYQVPGSFVIYNPNEDEVTADISFTHSKMVKSVGGYPHTVTLKSGERRKIDFYIVTTNSRGNWRHTIGVSSSKGGSATVTAEVKTI